MTALSEETLAPIRLLFFQECEDLLLSLETGLSQLYDGDENPETINTIFRAVHSIKGGAATFAFAPLVRLSHVFESSLNELRKGSLKVDPDLLKLFLKASDRLADLVRASRDGRPSDEEALGLMVAELQAGTERCGQKKADPAPGPAPAIDELDFEPVAADPTLFADVSGASPGRWTIWFRPHAALYFKANDPITLLRELRELGALEVSLDSSKLPLLEDLEPEESYLAWSMTLSSSADEKTIRNVFEFVQDDCDLSIAPQSPELGGTSAGGEGPAKEIAPHANKVVTSPASAVPVSPAKDLPQTVRVNLDRVDRLVNLVSEMVIGQGALTEQILGTANDQQRSSMLASVDDLGRLSREIQESVMALRAQPVKTVFQRMTRLVRELESMTGKQVQLVLEGEETEVDKTVIEHLVDPITHMIRNAVDHGIEAPAERLASGKPAKALVRLGAFHRSGRIVIEVSDDGKGIDRDRVLGIARARGLVSDGPMTEPEIDELIFMPGFSTAETVSDISGRGVGLDVVRRSIQSLDGRISIASTPGKGSTFILSLPLTLAVIEGMVVVAAGQTLIIPITGISEVLQARENNIRRLGANMALVSVRNDYVPIVDLGVALGYTTEPANVQRGVVILVEGENGGKAALLVDHIEGQRQVVIKSIKENYTAVEGVTAATILGDGRVAFITDVDVLIRTRQAASRNNSYQAIAG